MASKNPFHTILKTVDDITSTGCPIVSKILYVQVDLKSIRLLIP
jgi:hypothetical protein